MIHGKTVWKPGVDEIAKAFRVIALEPHKGSLQHPIWTPQLQAAMWTYGHKTQSFMKKGGQQKCLDKALHTMSLSLVLVLSVVN